ncbi:MAG: phosphotransferase [Flavobacteriaceae bacterium]|nr:phosphotransferase [Flavobacteriaceae bacterium]
MNPVLQTEVRLGRSLGLISGVLSSFSHPAAHRSLDWDIAMGLWTKDHLKLFAADQRGVLSHFQQLFEKEKPFYDQLRKAVVHNDSNDNNIVVSEDLIHPKINAVIDFGDSVYTETIKLSRHSLLAYCHYE